MMNFLQKNITPGQYEFLIKLVDIKKIIRVEYWPTF